MGILESIQKRGILKTIDRIGENVVWDMRDALPSEKAPLTVYEDLPEDGMFPLIDRLLNRTGEKNGQTELWEKIKDFPTGTYVAHDRVGSSAEGTAHLHFFVVDRTEKGAKLLFVDPEHYLNKSKREKGQVFREGDVRPQVCNLMAIRMRDGEGAPDVAIVRFRSSDLSQEEVSFETQVETARSLFETNGTPAVLKGKENDIVFRLLIEPSSEKPMVVQSRYTDDVEELRTFLQSGTGFSFLRGKVRSFAGLTGEFLARLQRKEFKPRTGLTEEKKVA